MTTARTGQLVALHGRWSWPRTDGELGSNTAATLRAASTTVHAFARSGCPVGVGGLPTVPPLGVKGAPQAPHPHRGRPRAAALDPEPVAARRVAVGAGTACPSTRPPTSQRLDERCQS